jgi:hypothetical protein
VTIMWRTPISASAQIDPDCAALHPGYEPGWNTGRPVKPGDDS